MNVALGATIKGKNQIFFFRLTVGFILIPRCEMRESEM